MSSKNSETGSIPMSDQQIGEKLGMDERTVSEIRCVAEREYYPIEEWERARTFKENVCSGYARQGLSFVTKKYMKKKTP